LLSHCARDAIVSADSCDVDQHSWLKPITIPAIPIKVGAQRRWRD
jgi:hypothetical protein